MVRKPNIKWRDADTQRLENEIKRFNAKIYRTKRNHPELADILPTTIKKADKLKMFADLKDAPRSEFNKQMNSLARFNRKGAEKPVVSKTGLKATAWEKREIGLKVAQINRERTKERKRLEAMDVTSRGEPVGLKRGQMGSIRMNELRPKTFNFDKIRSGKEWEKYKESVNAQTDHSVRKRIMEGYKTNYLKAIDNVFGDHATKLKDMLSILPAELINDTYYSEQEADIQYVYEPQQLYDKLTVLMGIWGDVTANYVQEVYG